MTLTADSFEYIRDLVLRQSAVALRAEQRYLAESRLLSLAREQGHATVDEFVSRLRGRFDAGLSQQVVEAMTTNETTFFRDRYPFEMLRSAIIPELIERRAARRSLSIWSAACSTGQEPYSIAMLLREHFPALRSWDVRLVASDFCTSVIERARAARYAQLEVNRGLPAALLIKYFEKHALEWRLNDDIRNLVQFHQRNLAASHWAPLPMMDVIFLRNVLIYFDEPIRKRILGNIRRVLQPDGYLFLGGAESVLNLDGAFECVSLAGSKCFRLRDRAAPTALPLDALPALSCSRAQK